MSDSYLDTAFQSRIAKQITLWVFGSLLAIEAIILLPSYVKREAELLATQTSLVTNSLETALNHSATKTEPPQASEIVRALEHLKSKDNILDYALLQQNGKGLEPHTASFEVTAQDIKKLLDKPAFNRLAQTYDAVIELEYTDSPLAVVARHDTHHIQRELNAYTLRMLAMILLISVVVTLGTMVGVERLVIRPVLYLHKDLLLAGNHIRQGIQESPFQATTLQRNNELGEVINEFEHLYDQIWQAMEARATANLLEQQERSRADQLQDTLHQLHQTQAQLVQAEKMSGLGQLVAGIAHEINNPINFIHGNLKHSQRYVTDLLDLVQLYQQHYPTPVPDIQSKTEDIDLAFIQTDLLKILGSMQHGSERVKSIVLSLRNFSRFDESAVKSVDIHQGLESSLMLLKHRMKTPSDKTSGQKSDNPLARHTDIQIVKDYGELPPVECYASLLNQVFMNILTNALDAIAATHEEQQVAQTQSTEQATDQTYRGQIMLRTHVIDGQWVQIAIANNGAPMQPYVQQRIFDPFFTTKPVGQGTGMGLSISYQIVTEKHHGTLECKTTPEKGTEFIIQIPLKQNA